MLSTFPVDVLRNIFSYLGPEEVAIVRATCNKFRISADSPVIWLRYLNRLKALDKEISVIPPEGNPEGWCYSRFVEGFKQIAQDQQKQVQRIHDEYDPPRINEILQTYNAPVTTLKDLEDRHEMLEQMIMMYPPRLYDLPRKLTVDSEFSNLHRNQLWSLPQKLPFSFERQCIRTNEFLSYVPTFITAIHTLHVKNTTNLQSLTTNSPISPQDQSTGGEKRDLESDEDTNNNDKEENNKNKPNKKPKK